MNIHPQGVPNQFILDIWLLILIVTVGEKDITLIQGQNLHLVFKLFYHKKNIVNIFQPKDFWVAFRRNSHTND